VCDSSVAESSTAGGFACGAPADEPAPVPVPAPRPAPLRLPKNWPIMSGSGRMPPWTDSGSAGAAAEGVAGSGSADGGTTHGSRRAVEGCGA
jgi:hypothetical protein